MSNDDEKKKGARIREPFVPIPNDVFENLVVRWPLSLHALHFAGYVARWSWGWQGNKWTREPLRVPAIAKFARMHRTTAWRAKQELVHAGIIEIRSDGHARINTYKLAECCESATSKPVARSQPKKPHVATPQPNGCELATEQLRADNQDSLHEQEHQGVTKPERQKDKKDINTSPAAPPRVNHGSTPSIGRFERNSKKVPPLPKSRGP